MITKSHFTSISSTSEFDDLFDAAAQEMAEDLPDGASPEDGVQAWLQSVGLGNLRNELQEKEFEESY